MKAVLALTVFLVAVHYVRAALLCPKRCRKITDSLEARLDKRDKQMDDLQKKLRSVAVGGASGSAGGAVYTRWGRKECPTGATLVYEGVAGGSHYSHSGGGANYLCLPRDPQFKKTTAGVQSCGAFVYGAEYELCANDPISSEHSLHNNDVICAVCQSPRPKQLMIPARQDCPTGWEQEYQGYLMTSHVSHKRTEFVCMDETPKGDIGSHENKDGALFYAVEAQCGSLPCPNYISGYEITCVVCTK